MKTASELPVRPYNPSTRVKHGDAELARKLLELRRFHSLTTRQVADQAGISVRYLGRLERAYAMPTVAKLARLAAFYETTLDALAGHMVEAAKSEEDGG